MSIPRPEHPRPDFRRTDWFNLNGGWEFAFDDGALTTESVFPLRIQVPFSWASPLSGIHEDRKGVAWYARSLSWRPKRNHDHIWLVFMAVDYTCQVYLNGQHIGDHIGGYDTFAFDLTPYWREENRLVVRVEDNDLPSQASGKQGYGQIRGIWQTVYLEARPASYIDNLRFETHCDGRVRTVARITGAKEIEEAQEIQLDFGPGAQGGAELQIAQPHLWSPGDSYLYEGTVTYGEDIVHTYFGIREINTALYGERRSRWITLNGEPVYLNGALDQSFNPQGFFTLPSEQEIIDEVLRLKKIGLNFVRLHIKPEEPRKLYWLDKLGILVMADMACFWGEPLPQTQAQYERELLAFIRRDWNHPSIISWVIFNETWGLFSEIAGGRIYAEETQRWVLSLYEKVKELDNSRLVEDNSPCNYDHLKSDLNSWHFYIHGYRPVMDHIRDAVNNTYPGSRWNYARGYVQDDAPLLNSECGMVWGVNGSAGDSDLAWHYHYMLNEFRLHDTICGFIFTEFHDVVNEFNGYYRLDNQPKDFGYQEFCEGMSIADLHAADFVAYDAPPCRTVGAGEVIATPLIYSNFNAHLHGRNLTLRWQLQYEGARGSRVADSGMIYFGYTGYGAHPLGVIEARMPYENAVAILGWQLIAGEEILSRNFTTFDVRGQAQGVSVPVAAYNAKDWELSWHALSDHKVCGAGEGSFTYAMDIGTLLQSNSPEELQLVFEAGAKRVLRKDAMKQEHYRVPENFFTTGAYAIDPGENPNSYLMSDTSRFPSRIEVRVNGLLLHSEILPNDPADCRGVLSWHYQQRDRVLDEAGSYGYLVKVPLTAEALQEVTPEQGVITVEIKAESGLALYGRNAGRYPVDITVTTITDLRK